MHRFLGAILLALSYAFLALVLAVTTIGGRDFVINGSDFKHPTLVQFGRPT